MLAEICDIAGNFGGGVILNPVFVLHSPHSSSGESRCLANHDPSKMSSMAVKVLANVIAPCNGNALIVSIGTFVRIFIGIFIGRSNLILPGGATGSSSGCRATSVKVGVAYFKK
jgi:hypothetical protein